MWWSHKTEQTKKRKLRALENWFINKIRTVNLITKRRRGKKKVPTFLFYNIADKKQPIRKLSENNRDLKIEKQSEKVSRKKTWQTSKVCLKEKKLEYFKRIRCHDSEFQKIFYELILIFLLNLVLKKLFRLYPQVGIFFEKGIRFDFYA